MKTYHIIDIDHSSIEYTITVEDIECGNKIFKMLYGNNFTENLVGTVALSAIDNGNEIIMGRQFTKKLPYYKFSQIRLLFSFINNTDKSMDSKYKFVCEDELKEL